MVAAILASVLGATSPAAAGPWTPEPGHGYAKLWLKYFYGYSFIDQSQTGHGIEYHEIFLSTYAEVGLTDHFALVLHAPVVRSFHLRDPRDGSMASFVGPGDPTLSLRWQFLDEGRFVAAAQLGVRAPFGRAEPVRTVYTTDEGNAAIGALQLGSGVWDVPAEISAGYGWDWIYVAGSVGYILRTSGFRHVLTWSAEAGVTIERQWGVRARAVGHHPLDVFFDEEAPRHASPSGIGNGTHYIGFALEADYQFIPNYFLGLTVEGGLGVLQLQAGGPVVTVYFASRF